MAEGVAYNQDKIHNVRYDIDGSGKATPIVKAEITSGGGGGAVTIADGADVALGAKADAAVTDPAFAASVVAALKGLLSQNRATTLTLLASASRTATATSSAQQNYSYRRLIIIVNITANGGAVNMTPSLLLTDPVSGATFTLWSAANAIQGGDNTYAYYFGDGASGGNYSETVPIGAPGITWQFRMSHNNANSVTYSVSGILLP